MVATSPIETPDTAVGSRDGGHDLWPVTETLIAEFDGHLPAGAVIRQVARAREQLVAAGVRAGLVPATEAMARSRLNELVPTACRPPTQLPPTDEAEALGARIINDLFAVSLTLYSVMPHTEQHCVSRLRSAVGDLDEAISSLRRLLSSAQPDAGS